MLRSEVLDEIIILMEEVAQDNTVPKNTKERIVNSLTTLNQEMDSSIKASKVIHEMEEVSQNNNLESYTRTQLWNIVSLLEKL